MNHDFRKALFRGAVMRANEGADFDELLHPARAFARPSDVVDDPDLTLNEKRAILASWASDACAEEANPLLRKTSDGGSTSWDDVMDALKELDLRAVKSAAIRFDPELFWLPRRGLRRGPRGGPDRGSLPA
ncbi:MAG: hypothetical protein ABSE59_08755 [Opitutaceae bacterium]|jgi:hypothetical protein